MLAAGQTLNSYVRGYPRSVRVDNPGGQWVTIDTGLGFVPVGPFTAGVVIPLSLLSASVRASSSAPPGQTNPGGGLPATLTYSDVQAMPGYSLNVPPPAAPPAPGPSAPSSPWSGVFAPTSGTNWPLTTTGLVAGDAVVVNLATYELTPGTPTISDTAGNTYVRQFVIHPSADIWCWQWAAVNITANPGTITVVQTPGGGGAVSYVLGGCGFHHIASALDTGQLFQGATGNVAKTMSGFTPAALEMVADALVTFQALGSGPPAPGSGWTLIDTIANGASTKQQITLTQSFQVFTAGGTPTFSTSFSGSTTEWFDSMLAIKQA